MNDYTPTFVAKQITSRLRGAIAQHDISQTQLAILCDVSQSQFSKIIRGVRPMTVDQLVVIAQALGIDLGAMLAKVTDQASSMDALASPLIFVEDGITLDVPYDFDERFLDPYGARAYQRLESAAAATVPIEVHTADEGTKRAYGLAAKRGRRKADEQPHAE